MSEVHRRRILGAALLAVGSSAVAVGAPPGRMQVPPIGLPASDGLPVLAEQPSARVTYIDFWASWCAPCRLSFPWMNDMHEQLAPRGLRIVAVSLDREATDAQRFLAQVPARFALAFDPTADAALALEVRAMPHSFLITDQRVLVASHRGFRLSDRADLEQRLRAALA